MDPVRSLQWIRTSLTVTMNSALKIKMSAAEKDQVEANSKEIQSRNPRTLGLADIAISQLCKWIQNQCLISFSFYSNMTYQKQCQLSSFDWCNVFLYFTQIMVIAQNKCVPNFIPNLVNSCEPGKYGKYSHHTLLLALSSSLASCPANYYLIRSHCL